MKIRNGFVSNSSSTSFTCDVCGYECGGWDYSLDDANMYQCENGHTFCSDERLITEDSDWDNVEDYEGLPAKFCPVCNMHAVTNLMKMDYVAFKYNFKWADITAEIKSKFKTYDEMITAISDSYSKGDEV